MSHAQNVFELLFGTGVFLIGLGVATTGFAYAYDTWQSWKDEK